MKSATIGNPSAILVVSAQDSTQPLFTSEEHSEPRISNFEPLNMVDCVTGVINAASGSIHATTGSFL